MSREAQIGRELAKIGLKLHLRSRNSTNNRYKPKNLHTTYIIPHIIMFQNNLGLNDSKSTNWMGKGRKLHLRSRNSTNN